MLKKALAIGGASAALLMGGYGVAQVNEDAPRSASPPEQVLSMDSSEVAAPNEVIVVFKEDTSPSEITETKESVDAVDSSDLDEGNVTGNTTELVEVEEGSDVSDVVAELSADPNVESVSPNYVVESVASSDDPFYLSNNLWGMYGDSTTPGNPFGSQAAEVWEDGNTGSNTVVIGVIDEGIQVAHPDLVNNIWVNPNDPIDLADNDGNGYIDDINGWDFENEDNGVYDGLFDDHGTHVAGTIGAEGGNALGVAGVNWDVEIINGRFLGSGGTGTTADAIEAINYMTDLKLNHGINIVATSNSWGCQGCFSAPLQAAIEAGGDADILFIAAAGNDGVDNDSTPHYPANYSCAANSIQSGAYDCIISVAAIDSTGALAGFSNYGATTVDLGAPGVGIVSTVPPSAYSSYNGTSMATPHVTGAAALISSINPADSASDIRSTILSNVAITASLADTVTGGRLDLSFLAGMPTPPPVGSVTVCHATETIASVGPYYPDNGLFITYSKVFVDRDSANEVLHAGHEYDRMWLSSVPGADVDCPSPGNGLGEGGFVRFVRD